MQMLIKEIGSGNSLAVCPMDDAMHRIKEGVDKSSPSETKNVFPAAAEWICTNKN